MIKDEAGPEDQTDTVDVFSAPEIETPIIEINTSLNLRPDLSALGIDEADRGVCEDTYENRALLRRAHLNWMPVYATNGVPTGLIQAVSQEMQSQQRVMSLSEKRPILTNPDNRNSDYLTGLDLLAEEATDYLVPPWVLGATRAWVKEQNTGPSKSPKRQPLAFPTRCSAIKEDGIRCQLWSSGRIADDGLCRVHLRSLKHRPGDDIERARAKLTQAAPYAVDILEQMMETAESEPVKLKAATEILDRAGVRGGIELDASVTLDARPAASVIAERLMRLAVNASSAAARLNDAGIIVSSDPDPAASGKTSNEEDSNIIDVEVIQDPVVPAEEKETK
jgi:hypothetical protein